MKYYYYDNVTILNISNTKSYLYYQELLLQHYPQYYSCAFRAILHSPDQLTCSVLWTHCF